MQNKEDYKWIRATFKHQPSGVELDFIHNIDSKDLVTTLFDSFLRMSKEEEIDVFHWCAYINALRRAGVGDFYAISWADFKILKEQEDGDV